jgi:hypothetical protein
MMIRIIATGSIDWYFDDKVKIEKKRFAPGWYDIKVFREKKLIAEIFNVALESIDYEYEPDNNVIEKVED